jgi:hypothetical protein
MIGQAARFGQNPVLFQQCMALSQECRRICDTIPPASIEPKTIDSLQAACDRCLEYGISEKSVQELEQVKGELINLTEPTGTDWGTIIGGGAVAGVLGLLLFGK